MIPMIDINQDEVYLQEMPVLVVHQIEYNVLDSLLRANLE